MIDRIADVVSETVEGGVRPTALLVDDEDTMRRYVSTVLRRGGYQVVEAGDGMDALCRIRDLRGAVDVLVTDIRMPRMTGTELVAAVTLEFPSIPVVFISGEQLEGRLHHPSRRMLFLQKPFRPQAILDAVETVSNRTSADFRRA